MSDLRVIRNWRALAPSMNEAVDAARPWVMPLVLRLERGDSISHQAALAAASHAVVSLLADPRADITGQWHEPLISWMSGRIRKVVRRARASKWDAVINAVPGIAVSYNGIQVFVGAPHPADETPAELARLQVSGLDLPVDPAYSSIPSNGPALHVVVNPTLGMSTGKAMAQVGHASQLALLQLDRDKVLAWSKNFEVVVEDARVFDEVAEKHVQVQDAGFTEIPAGSLTVKAWLN